MLITRVCALPATEVDGETVLIRLEQGQCHGPARTAHVIWELLAAPRMLGELCATLGHRQAGAPEAIAADTRDSSRRRQPRRWSS